MRDERHEKRNERRKTRYDKRESRRQIARERRQMRSERLDGDEIMKDRALNECRDENIKTANERERKRAEK